MGYVLCALVCLITGFAVGRTLPHPDRESMPLPAYYVGSGLWLSPSDELPPYLPGIGDTRPPEVARCRSVTLRLGTLETCGWPLQPDGSCLVAHEHWGHTATAPHQHRASCHDPATGVQDCGQP